MIKLSHFFPTLEVIPAGSPWILLELVCKANVDNSTDTWTHEMIALARKYLRNQVTSTTNHFQTVGEVYSFGLVGHFGKIRDNLSVGSYCLKDKSKSGQESSNFLMKS